MKLLFRLVILSVCFLCVGKVYAENVSNLSYMITNREVWKISEIKRKIDSNKISYIPEINLLSFQEEMIIYQLLRFHLHHQHIQLFCFLF